MPCLCKLEAQRTKFDARARKSMFLGYKDGTKGYLLYDLSSHQIFASTNVLFYESIFPFPHSLDPPSTDIPPRLGFNNGTINDDFQPSPPITDSFQPITDSPPPAGESSQPVTEFEPSLITLRRSS